MRTKSYTIYKFDELPEDVKKLVVEKNRDINVDFEDWCDYVIDDAKEIGKLMGIDIDRIYFSGFWSQGDGACFEGDYSYKIGSVKAVKSYAPMDKELHRIAVELAKAQRKFFFKLSARIKQSGHYMHEMCTNIEVFDDYGDWVNEYAEESIKEVLRDYMRWIYKQLEENYEFLTNEDAIIETLMVNDFEFDEYGNIA